MTGSVERPGALMAAEIAEQPTVLEALLRDGAAQIADASRTHATRRAPVRRLRRAGHQ